MNELWKRINAMFQDIKNYIQRNNVPTSAGQKLYQTAKSHLGQDVTPEDHVADEYGCAEALNKIHELAFGEPIGGGASTYWLRFALKNHRNFALVSKPLAGDIIISYTGSPGSGKNGIRNGHVGICGPNSVIMSNSSKTGKWEENYTLYTWRQRYQVLGNYPVEVFRKII